MIDKVLSSVITLVVVLLAGLFLYTSLFTGQAGERALARQSYEQEHADLLIRSLMLSTEGESGMTYESLLVRAMRDVSTDVSVGDREVDVKARFAGTLDALVGEGNYYFEVRPKLSGVSVSYILDASSTMESKRAAVNATLPTLIDSLKDILGENATVATHLYILGTTDGVRRCPEFGALLGPHVTCEDLAGDPFYRALMLKGFSPPTPEPYASFNEWTFATHAARTAHLSQSDWASAVAYASYRYRDDAHERARTNEHVIVAVADELTSSSKSDECYGLRRDDDFFICVICDATCPLARADGVVNQTAQVLAGNGDFFMGFHDFSCDYEYSSGNDQLSLSPYACQFVDDRVPRCAQVRDLDDPDTPDGWINPAANLDWCAQSACGGCTPSPTPGKHCFHRNCDAQILAHLERLAGATGGDVLDLTDLSQLTGAVVDHFSERVSAFDFAVGTRNLTRDRYAIERTLTLADGDEVTLTFWIYD